MNVAVLIGVETYADPRMKSVPFAEVDAKALASTLKQVGFADIDQVVLLGDQATKRGIESRLARVLKGLGTDDELLLYYVGHICLKGECTYLACHDIDPDDPVSTAIELNWLCERLASSDCSKIAFFLDAHCVVRPANSQQELPADLYYDQLETYFSSNQKHVCFAASKAGESSHSSGTLKHGIWAHHVIEAFAGKAPAALVDETHLTAASLQNYLQREIPRTLTRTFSTKKAQTPWMSGQGEYRLADMADILAKRSASSDSGAIHVKNVTLLSQRTRNIRSLSGYEKTFKQPDRANAAADAFIARISTKEVTEDIDRIFAQLKSAFKFKRADLHITNRGDGAATIITPYFNYSVTVSLHRADTSQALFRRTVDAIKDFDRLRSPAFGRIFQEAFDTIEFDTPTVVDLPAFIDRVEELDDGRIRVDYDPKATHCIVYMKGLAGTVKITSRTVSIVHLKLDLPESLLRSFYGILQLLHYQPGAS